MAPESTERAMLEIIAYHDPIDYHRLRRLVGERLDGEYSTDRHRNALQNLMELGLIERPGMAHEYVHITDEGWAHLGGEQPRHAQDVDPGTVPECPVCAADEIVEERW